MGEIHLKDNPDFHENDSYTAQEVKVEAGDVSTLRTVYYYVSEEKRSCSE